MWLTNLLKHDNMNIAPQKAEQKQIKKVEKVLDMTA